MKTLKEIVQERQPENVNKNIVGGVWGCPIWYQYLKPYLEEWEVKKNGCPKSTAGLKAPKRCEACWNRVVEDC